MKSIGFGDVDLILMRRLNADELYLYTREREIDFKCIYAARIDKNEVKPINLTTRNSFISIRNQENLEFEYNSSNFHFIKVGDRIFLVIAYRGDPYVLVDFGAQSIDHISDIDFDIIPLFCEIVINQLRVSNFEEVVDRSTEIVLDDFLSDHDDIALINVIAKECFDVEHVLHFGDSGTSKYSVVHSNFWPGSPASNSLQSKSAVRILRNLSNSNPGLSSLYIDQKGALRQRNIDTNAPPDDGCSATLFFYSKKFRTKVSAIVYVWDSFVPMNPGQRRAMTFFLDQHLSQLYLRNTFQAQVEDAFRVGSGDQYVKITQLYQAARHFVKNANKSIEAIAFEIEEYLQNNAFHGKLPHRLQRDIEYLKSTAKSSTSIIDSVRLSSKHSPEDDLVTLRIYDIFHAVKNFFGGALADIDATLEWAGKNPEINCYRGYMLQIFVNLVGNSLEFFSEREVHAPKIRFRVNNNAAERAYRVVYTDNAGGFRVPDKESPSGERSMTKDEIMGCFARGVTHREGGSGFGLWLVDRYVTAHNGKVVSAMNQAGGVEITLKFAYKPVSPTDLERV